MDNIDSKTVFTFNQCDLAAAVTYEQLSVVLESPLLSDFNSFWRFRQFLTVFSTATTKNSPASVIWHTNSITHIWAAFYGVRKPIFSDLQLFAVLTIFNGFQYIHNEK